MPQPKVLANMMLQEKKTGKLDDTPYIAYLVDSLGYTLKIDSVQIRRMGRYYQDLLKRGYVSKVLDHSMIWWVVIRLKEFGLKQTEGEGDYIDLKGKGLFAGTGSESISIGCWFDKK